LAAVVLSAVLLAPHAAAQQRALPFQDPSQPLTPAGLGHYDGDGRFVIEAGPFTVMVGSSSRDQDLTTVSLTVR
jgi:hypothetical protein